VRLSGPFGRYRNVPIIFSGACLSCVTVAPSERCVLEFRSPHDDIDKSDNSNAPTHVVLYMNGSKRSFKGQIVPSAVGRRVALVARDWRRIVATMVPGTLHITAKSNLDQTGSRPLRGKTLSSTKSIERGLLAAHALPISNGEIKHCDITCPRLNFNPDSVIRCFLIVSTLRSPRMEC
jgi:hypothetical protein